MNTHLSVTERHEVRRARKTVRIQGAGVLLEVPDRSQARQVIFKLTGRRVKREYGCMG